MTRQSTDEKLRHAMKQLGEGMATAARYILAHPEDVAVYSMRELARRAEVPPVTFVRLANRIGLAGYNELREHYVGAVLSKADDFKTRNALSAQSIIADAKSGSSAAAFAKSFFAREQELLRDTLAGLSESSLIEASTLLAIARRVYIVGRRTSFPAAFALAYALSKARPGVKLLDNSGGTPESGLDEPDSHDVLVAITFAPFGRVTVSLAEQAAKTGARIIAISDTSAVPLHALAGNLLFITPSLSRAFPESVSSALALANLLAALTIARLGEPARERIRRNEQYLIESGEFMIAGRRSQRRRPS